MRRIIQNLAAIFVGALLSVVLFLAPASTVMAKNWSDGTATWSPGTWSPAGPPVMNEAVNIVFTDGTQRIVTLNVSPLSLGLLSVDLTGAGTAVSTLSMPNNNTLSANGILIGGYNGTATTAGRGAMTQSAGTATTNPGWDLVVGYGANSTGTYTLSGGTLVANQSEFVGLGGDATFNQTAGSNTINSSAVGIFSIAQNNNSTSAYNLSGTGSLTINTNEYVGYDGLGYFTQSGGTHTVGTAATNRDLYLSYSLGRGNYTLLAGMLTVNGSETVGYGRPGIFTQSGGTHTVSNSLLLGASPGGQGNYALSDGTLTVRGLENIAGIGSVNNSFTQSGGFHTVGDPSSHTGLLGIGAYSSSIASYSLTSGDLTVNGAEQVGGSGSATFTQNGGTNTIIRGPDPYVGLYLATNAGGSGTYSLSGNGILSVTGDADIGGYFDSPGGTGVMNLSSGTATTTGTMKVWNTAGSAVNLTGATLSVGSLDTNGNAAHFNWTAGTLNLTNSNLTIGSAGPLGTSLTIDSAKVLTVSGTTTIDPLRALTLSGGSISTVSLINGGTFTYVSGSFSSRLLNQGVFNMAASYSADNGVQNDTSIIITSGQTLTASGAGFDNRGTLIMADATAVVAGTTFGNTGLVRGEGLIATPFHNNIGGELRAEPGKSLTLIGAGNTNAGRINLVGGLIEFTHSLTNNAGGLVSGNGTLITGNGLLNQGVMNFGGTANLLGDVTNSATGRIISTGGGATIFFDDVANQGEIRTSAKGFTIFFGSVSGAGMFTGTGTVNFEGDLSPGSSPATIQFAGDVAFGADATLQIELGGITPGTEHDKISVTGDLGLGGTLQVSLISGFTPSDGQSFGILNWGSLSGTFSSFVLPTLAGLSWNTSQLYTTGVLSVAATGIPGDYNNSGTVDAADYVMWRLNPAGHGGTPGGYNTWRANFGAPGSDSGTSVNAAVPEPATLVLMMFATAGWGFRRGPTA